MAAKKTTAKKTAKKAAAKTKQQPPAPTWTVTSSRLRWPAGSVLDAHDLDGLNVDALLAGGHLAGPPAPKRPVQPGRAPGRAVPYTGEL